MWISETKAMSDCEAWPRTTVDGHIQIMCLGEYGIVKVDWKNELNDFTVGMAACDLDIGQMVRMGLIELVPHLL